MKNKTEVSFNQQSYEIQFNTLNENIKRLTTCLDAIEKITGHRELTDIQTIEKAITEKTGFANVPASATLLNLNDEYFYLVDNLSAIQTDIIDFETFPYTIKESVLKELKTANTTYLKDHLEQEYKTLLQICEAANKLTNPANSKYLKIDYTGKYSIALMQFNNQI